MTTLTQDQERAAYISGDVKTAELLGRIAELESDADRLERLEDERAEMELDLDSAEASIAELIDALETAVEWAQEKYPPDELPRWAEEAMDAIKENQR